MEPLLLEPIESPRLQLRGIPSFTDSRLSRIGDRFTDRRGSTSDALLDFRSPRFESLDAVRRANLRIDRRQTLMPSSAESLDLHTPRGEEAGVLSSLTRSDVRLDDLPPQSTPLIARRSGSTSSPLAIALSRRDTLGKGARGHDNEVVKGMDKEVQKFVEQEDEKRYKRALSVLDSGPDDLFAILPSTPERKKIGNGKAKGSAPTDQKNKPLFVLTRAMLTDVLWTAGAFSVAVALGLLLLRIERAIRSLARQNPIGKMLRALWTLMFMSVRSQSPRR